MYQTIVQYVQHIASVKGGEFQSILDELAVHVKQELDHALTLARQIDFLGGTPSTKVPAVPSSTDARGVRGSRRPTGRAACRVRRRVGDRGPRGRSLA